MNKQKNLLKSIYNKDYLKLLPDFKEERTQAFTTIALTLAAISIFGVFAISPTLSTIGNLKKQLDDNLFVEKKLEEKIANLSVLQLKYSLIEKDIPLILSLLPQKPNIPFFLGQLQSIAKSSNLNVTRIQSSQVDLTKPKDVLDKYSSFAFSLDGEASSYMEITDFLSKLLNFDRIITIDMLSINNKTEKKDVLKFSLRGRAYFKK
ncbi:hypothetical protein C4559_05990 [Candidatus Microgenomates bacterium]|nr:MAG: hypothetical protein C4559_05990 [Candidatus Microgenomates bacterium]